MVVNSPGGRHTHTDQRPHKSNFKKPGVLAFGRRAPGLKIACMHVHMLSNIIFFIMLSVKVA